MHDRVLAGEAACLQFLHGALGGDVRVLGEQLPQDRLERIDDALAWPRPRAGVACPSRWACTRASARCTAPREIPNSSAIARCDIPL